MRTYLTFRHGVFAVGVALVLVLTSCIDVESELRIRDDGSGTLSLRYTVTKALLNLGTTDEEKRFYALPISEADFENTVGAIDGLTLSSFDVSEEVDMVHVEAELAFQSIESLSEFFSSSGPGAVELAIDNGSTTLRHVVFSGTGSDVDAESAQLIETFFDGYMAVFSVRAPSAITSVSAGSFSGKTATVEYSMPRVIMSEAPIIWEVTW